MLELTGLDTGKKYYLNANLVAVVMVGEDGEGSEVYMNHAGIGAKLFKVVESVEDIAAEVSFLLGLGKELWKCF